MLPWFVYIGARILILCLCSSLDGVSMRMLILFCKCLNMCRISVCEHDDTQECGHAGTSLHTLRPCRNMTCISTRRAVPACWQGLTRSHVDVRPPSTKRPMNKYISTTAYSVKECSRNGLDSKALKFNTHTHTHTHTHTPHTTLPLSYYPPTHRTKKSTYS